MASRVVGRKYVVGAQNPSPFDEVTYEVMSKYPLVWDGAGYRAVLVDATYAIAGAEFRVFDQTGALLKTAYIGGPADLILTCRYLYNQDLHWAWDGRIESTGERAAFGRYYVGVFVTFLRRCVPNSVFAPNIILRADPVVAVSNPERSPTGPAATTHDKPPDAPPPDPPAIPYGMLAAAVGAYLMLK